MRAAHINLMQLRVLVALAERGSFTAAADRLALTQPAISHTVRNLEAELGVRLFERQRDRTVPTAAGRMAIAEARAALVHIERLEHAVRGEAALRTGQLRLACFPSAANWILPRAIAEFHARHPGIEVEVRELADETCVRAVRDRVVDLGMVNLPCEDLATFPLFEDDLAVVASAKRWPGRSAIDVRDLAGEPFIRPHGALEPLIDAAFVGAGIEPKLIASTVTQDAGLVLSLVRVNMGFTIMPGQALVATRLRGLRVLRLRPKMVRRVAFAAASNQTISPAALAFLNLLLERIGLRQPREGSTR